MSKDETVVPTSKFYIFNNFDVVPVVGGYAKVKAGEETFWAEIISVDSNRIRARVDNDLIRTASHGLVCDDIIEFGLEHIKTTEVP